MANYFVFVTVQDYKEKNSYALKIEEKEDLPHKDFVLIDGCDRVRAEINHTLKFWKGEDCLNVNDGFDYPTFFREYNAGNKRLARAMIINAIMKIKDVEAIESLEMVEDRDNHILNVYYRVKTKYGYVVKDRNAA